MPNLTDSRYHKSGFLFVFAVALDIADEAPSIGEQYNYNDGLIQLRYKRKVYKK